MIHYFPNDPTPYYFRVEPDERPASKPRSRYDDYMDYIHSIENSFNEFSDGWGGDDTPRRIAMQLYPFDEWNSH